MTRLARSYSSSCRDPAGVSCRIGTDGVCCRVFWNVEIIRPGNRHGMTEGKRFVRRIAEQFVGRLAQADAEIFKDIERGRSVAAGNVAKVSGAHMTKLGSSLVIEITKPQNALKGCG